MKLVIKRGALEEIIRRCVDSYPYETAGLMLGKDNIVFEALHLRNVHEDDHRVRYRLDPMEYYAAEKTAEAKGYEVLGVYHSHPDVPAVPSQYDLQYALPPWSYLIVSVTSGKHLGYNGWKAVERDGIKRFEKLDLLVED